VKSFSHAAAQRRNEKIFVFSVASLRRRVSLL